MATVPSLRQRNRDRTAADIESAAFGLFAAAGFDAVTVEQIAAAAGVSTRTFFRYFRAKEDVVFGDHHETVARLRAALRPEDPSEPPLDRVRRAVLAVQSPDRDPTRERVRARLITQSPVVRARASLLVDDMEAAAVDHLTDAFAPHPDAPVRANLIGGAVFGALRGARRAAAADPAADPAALVAAAFDLVTHGASAAFPAGPDWPDDA